MKRPILFLISLPKQVLSASNLVFTVWLYCLDEMNRIGRYEILERIGGGVYGQVFKAQFPTNYETVAMKMFALRINYEENVVGVHPTATREVSLLQEMQHENIVRLLDIQYTENRMFLVFEYMDMDLHRYIRSSPDFANNFPLIKKFLHQILRGLAYCHSCKILHRDLKPTNLLVDWRTHTVKIADFGLSRKYIDPETEGPYTPEVVTLRYRAPELLLGTHIYSTPVDVWSVGCIFAEMVNRRLLFTGTTGIGQLFEIFRVFGTPNEDIWPGVTMLPAFQSIFPYWDSPLDLATIVPGLERAGVDLLSRMLRLDPSTRITAEAALEHPYFTMDGYVP